MDGGGVGVRVTAGAGEAADPPHPESATANKKHRGQAAPGEKQILAKACAVNKRSKGARVQATVLPIRRGTLNTNISDSELRRQDVPSKNAE